MHVTKSFLNKFYKQVNNFSRNSFFPSTIIEWNNLDMKIRNSETFSAFKKSILKFIRPSSNSISNCHIPNGIKLITRLRSGHSHLLEHKFRHKFRIILIQFAVQSWTTFPVLEKTFIIKVIPKSQNCFYLAFLQIIMHQKHVFWMLPSNRHWLLKDLTSLLLTLESFEVFIFFNTYINTTIYINSSHKI